MNDYVYFMELIVWNVFACIHKECYMSRLRLWVARCLAHFAVVSSNTIRSKMEATTSINRQIHVYIMTFIYYLKAEPVSATSAGMKRWFLFLNNVEYYMVQEV